MLKIIGIILISGAISMYGAYKAGEIKSAKEKRYALFELVLYIKECIENGSFPLKDIFDSFENNVLFKCGFLGLLRCNKENAFLYALTECKNLNLNEDIKKLYTSLAEKLGKSYFSNIETDNLSKYITLIKSKEEYLSKQDEVHISLYKKLGVLCGLLAAVLLI